MLRPDDHGPDVEWLAKQLASLDGKAVKTIGNQVFDAAMMREVKQFQLAHGLVPDGVVGNQTMMQLSSAADLKAPKLKLERGKKQ